ncbi:class III extradiol dioxygenase family protein [Aurantiacibacter sp. MUD11]|uniref:class III extradiol dioxygenase family protein n=1 Tax=Aurantiacibacter sp. MUD11 TaxID=3003265 RepID=UPI0022AAE337|nr:class III extradiol dioxygenase family protein [Aurantiacibacter sp. MUD11]WAT18186.1 class III extradiol dioxygenase family protein [Aurantiacibacter sp. MUD11]
MSNVIGGLFTSHVPAIGNAIAKGLQDDPYWKPFFDGYDPVHQFLRREQPDVAVVFYNDHGLNFFLDKMPTFAIGAAPAYKHEDEGWGIAFARPYPGHPELSWHIIEEVVGSDFDPVTCQAMTVDHAVAVPFELSWPGAEEFPVKLVPIAINTVQHPLPSPRRCFELGKAVGRALESWSGDEKIVVMGTGGLSHQLEGGRAGHINVDYDRFCLRNLGPDPEALLQHSSLDIVELAGSQGVEILNWIAARGALRGSITELASNYHVPISNTAAATVLLENKAKVSA